MGATPRSADAATSADSPAPLEPVCPGCGYDLRGHVGEVMRCPECGREWLREIAAAQARYSAREGRRRAVAAADSALRLGLVAVVSAAFGGWRWAWGIPFGLLITAWGVNVCRVARRSRRAPGWARALAAHHAWRGLSLIVLLGCLWVAAACVAMAFAFLEETEPLWQRSARAMLQAVCAAGSLASAGIVSKMLNRRGRRAIEQLHSEAGWAAAGAGGGVR